MALLHDFVDKYIWPVKKSVGPTFDLKGTEAWIKLFGYQDDFSNETVTERRAHGLATVFTCIKVRSETIAALPINVQLEENGTKRNLTDHPVYYPLSQQPNSYMSSANMFLTSMIHSDSWGNSVIGINRDGRTRPVSFDIVQPGEWDLFKKGGDVFYKINGLMYSARDVLHFRWFSYDGLIGLSPIRLNQITMGKAIKSERYSSYALGKKPPMMLGYEGDLTPEQKAENQKTWEQSLESGRTPILSGRWKPYPFLIPPGDAQYIETENLTDQKIYGIFRIPPSFAQNYARATWSNAEQSDLVFAKHTIVPIIRVIEQECNMKLFTEKEKRNTYVKFNVNGLLRGDITARAAFYTAMRNIGAMNGNEIRELEDRNAYEGGDIFTIQSGNAPVDMLRKFYENKVAPSAPPTEKETKLNGKFQHEFN